MDSHQSLLYEQLCCLKNYIQRDLVLYTFFNHGNPNIIMQLDYRNHTKATGIYLQSFIINIAPHNYIHKCIYRLISKVITLCEMLSLHSFMMRNATHKSVDSLQYLRVCEKLCRNFNLSFSFRSHLRDIL